MATDIAVDPPFSGRQGRAASVGSPADRPPAPGPGVASHRLEGAASRPSTARIVDVWVTADRRASSPPSRRQGRRRQPPVRDREAFRQL